VQPVPAAASAPFAKDRLGLSLLPDANGLRVAHVAAGSPAERASVREGDVVVAIDGKQVTDGIGLIVGIRSHQPGETVTLTVDRNGQLKKLRITLDSKVG
jgi:putative serine protease PepD